MPRFQHLGRLLQFLNLNVTKIFGSISSLNHHLGWPTRWKITRNLLSLTWCQETCLTLHLPHPSTVPCDCDRLVNVDTFTSLLFGWSFRSEGGAVGNCRGKRPFPNKKYWQALTSPKVKNSEFTPWNAMVAGRRAGYFPIARNKHLKNSAIFWGKMWCSEASTSKQKTMSIAPKKDVGAERSLVFRCDIFLVQKLVPISKSRGFWVWEKSFQTLQGS